jgi:predicted 3-demethylubiquinone-9 3-methyltransferase (glyoxalase superfamily)
MITHMWFTDDALEAAKFYVSLLPDSRIDRVTSNPVDIPGRPAGSVEMVDFTLAGQPFMAIGAGENDAFNHAISLMIRCEEQEEIDRLWSALLKGGSPEPCGWLKDRYGVSWQIVPEVLADMLNDPDRKKAARVMEALLQMEKIDIEELRDAFDGETSTRATAKRRREG